MAQSLMVSISLKYLSMNFLSNEDGDMDEPSPKRTCKSIPIDSRIENSKTQGHGYEYSFIDEPPQSLLCVLCDRVAREPIQHQSCGALYCKNCLADYKPELDSTIRNLKRTRASCPRSTCHQRLNKSTMFEDTRSAQDISSLKVKCDKNGCSWQGELGLLDDHTKKCEFILELCHKCDGKVLRKDVEFHRVKECPRRLYTCPQCATKGEYCEITSSHMNKCPQVEIKCLNSRCSDKIPRCKMADHKSTCPYELVECKHVAFGCKAKLPRKDLKKHEDDKPLHFTIMLEKMLQHQDFFNKRLELVEKTLLEMDKRIRVFEKK